MVFSKIFGLKVCKNIHSKSTFFSGKQRNVQKPYENNQKLKFLFTCFISSSIPLLVRFFQEKKFYFKWFIFISALPIIGDQYDITKQLVSSSIFYSIIFTSHSTISFFTTTAALYSTRILVSSRSYRSQCLWAHWRIFPTDSIFGVNSLAKGTRIGFEVEFHSRLCCSLANQVFLAHIFVLRSLFFLYFDILMYSFSSICKFHSNFFAHYVLFEILQPISYLLHTQLSHRYRRWALKHSSEWQNYLQAELIGGEVCG